MNELFIILEIISNFSDGLRGKTRLQKLVFLTQTQCTVPLTYDFEPAPLGPLSSDVNRYVSNLEELGLVEERIEKTPSGNNVFCYTLTEFGKTIVRAEKTHRNVEDIKDAVTSVCLEYGSMSYVDLLNYVHEKYPSYHIKGIM